MPTYQAPRHFRGQNLGLHDCQPHRRISEDAYVFTFEDGVQQGVFASEIVTDDAGWQYLADNFRVSPVSGQPNIEHRWYEYTLTNPGHGRCDNCGETGPIHPGVCTARLQTTTTTVQ